MPTSGFASTGRGPLVASPTSDDAEEPELAQDSVPGPGKYSPDVGSVARTSPIYSFGGRGIRRSVGSGGAGRLAAPGPGSYRKRDAVGPQTESIHKTAPQYRFGTGQRSAVAAAQCLDSPGPAAYMTRESTGSDQPAVSFAPKDKVKAAQLKGRFDDTSDPATATAALNPGPDAYGVDKHSSMGKQSVSKGRRGQSSPSAGFGTSSRATFTARIYKGRGADVSTGGTGGSGFKYAGQRSTLGGGKNLVGVKGRAGPSFSFGTSQRSNLGKPSESGGGASRRPRTSHGAGGASPSSSSSNAGLHGKRPSTSGGRIQGNNKSKGGGGRRKDRDEYAWLRLGAEWGGGRRAQTAGSRASSRSSRRGGGGGGGGGSGGDDGGGGGGGGVNGRAFDRSREYSRAPDFSFGSGERFSKKLYAGGGGAPSGGESGESPGPVYVVPSNLGDAAQFSFPRDSARYVEKVIRGAQRKRVPGPGAYDTLYLQRLGTLAREAEAAAATGAGEDDEGEGEDGEGYDGGGGAEVKFAAETKTTPTRPVTRGGGGAPPSAFTATGGSGGGGGGGPATALEKYHTALWAQEEAEYWKYGPDPLLPTPPASSFGKSRRQTEAKRYNPGPLNKPTPVSPGPARYSYTPIRESPRHSFGGKGIPRNVDPYKKKDSEAGPGPMSAVATSSFGKQSSSRSPNAPVAKSALADRDAADKVFAGKVFADQTPDPRRSPGPKYDLGSGLGEQSVSQRRSSPRPKFARSKRTEEASLGAGREVPGPGAYGNTEQHRQLIPTRSNIRNPNSISTTYRHK
eukprot:g2523.t1